MVTNKGLGKGLGALFGGISLDDELAPVEDRSAPASAQDGEVEQIAIAMIDNNVNQPRQSFDSVALQELADSIKQYGVIQPILITPVGHRFMIVAGERRWRAAKMAGLVEIPAVIKQFTPKQVAEIAIIENLQRNDLNEMELARGVKRLMQEYQLTQEKVAERLSKPRSTIANLLRLVNLPTEIQTLIQNQKLTAGHAIRLLALSDPEQQIKFARQAAEQGLSVRALGDLIEGKRPNFADFGSGKPKPPTDPALREQEKLLSRAVGTKVKIEGSLTSGKVVLAYYSADELERIVNYLKKHNI